MSLFNGLGVGGFLSFGLLRASYGGGFALITFGVLAGVSWRRLVSDRAISTFRDGTAYSRVGDGSLSFGWR